MMTKSEWCESLFAECVPSLQALQDVFTSAIACDDDALNAIATTRRIVTEILLTCQAATEAITGKPAALFSEDFIRAPV